MTISYIYNIRNEVVVFAQNNTTVHFTNFAKHESLRTRLKQVAAVSLIFLSMVTGEVFAGDKRPKSKANASRKQEATFTVTYLSNNLPDVVADFPLPDLIPSNPPVTPPPPPMPPLPDIVPPVILPDVVPVPPAPPMVLSQPDLVSDAAPKTKQNSGFIAAMKQIAKGNFKLKKVKQEPKPVVVSSSDQDLMSQLHNTLERRRKGVSGEESSNAKPKKVVKQAPILTAEEQAQKKAENLAKAATIREQNKKKWEEAAKKNEEMARERRQAEAEAVKERIEQKAKERGEYREGVVNGIDPVLHNNMVADLRQEISNLKEQLILNGNVTASAINNLDSNDHARSKRSLEGSKIVETKDQFTSTEDASLLEDRLFDDESLEDSSDRGSKNSSDTNYVVSRIVPQSNSIVSETVQDELAEVEQELQSQKLKEEESVESVEDILGKDLITDTGEQEETHNSTTGHQAELARRASIALSSRADLRFGSKLVSKQIRHRLLTRDIGNLVAVSAGDEEESQAPSYSVWSSGVFGGSKQKDTSNIIGHSSKIHGGTIGGEINLSSNLMFGVSYSRLSSKFKYPSMLDTNQNVSRTNTNIFSVYSGATLAANTNLQTLASVALSGKDAKQKNIIKPKSKQFSFESHLNQKITFQNNITLIPSIGFRYEYGRSSSSNNQILNSYIVHHKRSKSSTLSGEVGARVLFTPINHSSDFTLIPIVHISFEKRIASTGGKSVRLLSIKDIGGEDTVVSGSANHEKLSTNIGGGLIASHKNISLELLYDLQKQRRFKSHQGVLKLKVNL